MSSGFFLCGMSCRNSVRHDIPFRCSPHLLRSHLAQAPPVILRNVVTKNPVTEPTKRHPEREARRIQLQLHWILQGYALQNDDVPLLQKKARQRRALLLTNYKLKSKAQRPTCRPHTSKLRISDLTTSRTSFSYCAWAAVQDPSCPSSSWAAELRSGCFLRHPCC